MRANKNKYRVACISLVFALCFSGISTLPGFSQEASFHAQVTRQALSHNFCDANLKKIMDANDSQDSPGSEGFLEKRRHFDVDNITSALSYIDREKKRALNSAAEADTDPESRADALRHFGLLLHSVQDFYARTNYVELLLENPQIKKDPYNIPLVDWSKVPDGYTGLSGEKMTAARQGDDFDGLNKETKESPGGKKEVEKGITLHSVAMDLAIRETQRQWNMLEALIRSRCGERSASVLAALRQASDEAQTSTAADDNDDLAPTTTPSKPIIPPLKKTGSRSRGIDGPIFVPSKTKISPFDSPEPKSTREPIVVPTTKGTRAPVVVPTKATRAPVVSPVPKSTRAPLVAPTAKGTLKPVVAPTKGALVPVVAPTTKEAGDKKRPQKN